MEDPVARWKREADAQEARFAEEWRQYVREEEEKQRQRYALHQSPELGLQAQVFTEVADAIEGLNNRLTRVERRRKSSSEKAARKPRAVSLPNFLAGPTHAVDDPSVRYSQPRLTK